MAWLAAFWPLRTPLRVALLLQVTLIAWPTYVHLSNAQSLRDLDTLLLGADIHASPVEIAAQAEQIRHERYLSSLYPEPVVQHLLTLPGLTVECLIVQLWSLPLWCLAIAALLRRTGATAWQRLQRAWGAAALALVVVLATSSLLSFSATPAALLDCLRGALRAGGALLATSAIYLAALAALPDSRRFGPWKWTLSALAILWLSWALRASLLGVESPLADYLPGGVDRFLLSPNTTELVLGFVVAACASALPLLIERALFRATAEASSPSIVHLEPSLRSDVT